MRPEKPLQWLEIAEVLNLKFTTESREVQLKGRGCKERLFLLIKKYNDEDVRSLKRLCLCVCLSVISLIVSLYQIDRG